jgi:hypothetical protein
MSIIQQAVESITGNVAANQLDNLSRLQRMNCLLEQSNKLMDIVIANKKEIETLREQIGK